MLNLEELVKLKLKPVAPTVIEKIKDKMLVMQLEDGTLASIIEDRGAMEDDSFENMEEFTDFFGDVKDNMKSLDKDEIGIIIMTKYPEVKHVWLGDL